MIVFQRITRSKTTEDHVYFKAKTQEISNMQQQQVITLQLLSQPALNK